MPYLVLSSRPSRATGSPMTQVLDSIIWNPHIIAMLYNTDFPLFIDSNLESGIIRHIFG